MSDLTARIEEILPLVEKPSRYVGNELNVVKKDHRHVDVKVALAYPDAYEIGMSHLGLSILYHILNSREDAVAERVYAPWMDMESQLRKRGIPLFSLESHLPLRAFDIIGFSLQYELIYTNLINMLDLAGIPIRSVNRRREDPIIIAGGPSASNPEPMADFIDAFVIGDGEEAINQVADVIGNRRWKVPRQDLLKELSQIEGVYVPSLYRDEYDIDGQFLRLVPQEGAPEHVCFQKVPKLLSEYYPAKPLVPLTEIIHDRLSVEIMRGCTRRCRFCGAGSYYRPARERSVKQIVRQAKEGIKSSGWGEISLVSLSTTDYSCLPSLLEQLRIAFQDKMVCISLPSMRPDTFTPQLAKSLKDVYRAGLTFAPEAGSDRLRSSINKQMEEKTLTEAAEIAFNHGWDLIKLYFMIGLPNETMRDLAGIADIVGNVSRLGRRLGGKNLNVTISPFVPKAHTPFQWERQDSMEDTRKKTEYIQRRASHRNVNIKTRDPYHSFLEGIFSRGDRRLGQLLERAWSLGARFDAWGDIFQSHLWRRAIREVGIDPDLHLAEREPGKPLPWDHITSRITSTHLLNEMRKSRACRATESCRPEVCRDFCGVCRDGISLNIVGQKEDAEQRRDTEAQEISYGRRRKNRGASPQSSSARSRIRLKYSKGEEVRFTSHLDMGKIFERAIRRSGLPIAYSQGYHPRQRISFGPPLPLGFTSQQEYLDILFSRPFSGDVAFSLNRVLPPGVQIRQSKSIMVKADSLASIIVWAEYEVSLTPRLRKVVPSGIEDLFKRDSFPIQRVTKRGLDEVDMRPLIRRLSLDEVKNSLILLVAVGSRGHVKPQEIFKNAFVLPDEEIALLRIERVGLYAERDGELTSPMNAI